MDSSLVTVENEKSGSSIVIVCEHASADIPTEFGNLGLDGAALNSHIAWDPGALALATRMAGSLDAVMVASNTSRLVYDCNRPPDAPDAMPERSEIFDVPGNVGLSPAQKASRVATYYEPFRDAVSRAMASKSDPILVTVHSFTRVYDGKPRAVEIGLLHNEDARLTDALLATKPDMGHKICRNEPYGPDHGVMHTLKEHAEPGGHLNVMVEVRNDLIADEAAQDEMAQTLSAWLSKALAEIGVPQC